MEDPAVTHVGAGNSSEDKLKYLERQVKSVPHPATSKPNDEEFFAYGPDGARIPNLDFIREHFLVEGKLTEQQAIYIVERVTDVLSREPNLLSVPSPVIGRSPYATSVYHCLTTHYLSLRRRSRPVREYRRSSVA